ncbi:hypothetical protein E5329_13915 [Petralouisia muris]|uniref:Uncharacterized protein n=1 Tax=Petralouisia muris TaxID=3032872 RepID=A0AC61RVV1_9FIRM|nr:Firmicu-CTERM sorting domain-containing protein [Petralouisia muris]TGY95661.1 hypothetical protein E5329_13915 [Petralouisia muris]
MKANKIFRSAAAGLLSVSLLLSGLPVTAAELNPDALNQQAETTGGSENSTESVAASDQNPANGNESAPKDSEPLQDGKDAEADGTQTSEQNSGGEQSNPAGSQSEGSEDSQNQTGEQNNPDDSQSAGTEGSQNQAEETEDRQNSNDNEDSDTDDEKNEDNEVKDSMSDKTDGKAEDEKETLGEDSIAAAIHPSVSGSIAIDGNLSDWAGVTERSGSDVDYWKAAFSPDGNTLYFSFTGNATTEWDYNFTKNKFQFAYPDGISDISNQITVHAGQGKAEVKNAYFGNVAGAEAAVTNEAHGNNPGLYVVELAVPVSFFHSMDFTLTFGGTAIASSDIEQVNGDSITEDLPAVYAGISIDGNYSDWKAVAKTDASCPNSAHTECLSQVAAVFDGHWLYLYIKDGKGSNASGAGTHSNGKFAITSDLGYETDIQLSTAPTVSGVNGAAVAYKGSEWEVAIPKDQLPKYRESLSFGLYQGEPFLSGIVNLQPDSGNNLENLFDGIHFDGQYKDWEDYGHSTIQYATAGSQESQIDAKGALYSSDGKLYGHVVTNMPQHLQEAGQEFTEAITIAFNQSAESLRNGSVDQSMVFYPRFVTVDANGTIDWNPKRAGLPEGTYEYHIVSLDAWGQSQNISDLNDMDQIYGKMIMTIGKDGKDEMEYYLELPMIAEKLGVDAANLKEIAAQYGRIGQEWIFTAGTSTGPLAGVAICIASVGIVFWYRKRKKNELIPSAA